jgi:hypothetical protein
VNSAENAPPGHAAQNTRLMQVCTFESSTARPASHGRSTIDLTVADNPRHRQCQSQTVEMVLHKQNAPH